MRFFRFAVSVYHINNGNYITSPVSAFPTAAVIAADYIIVAVKADDAVENIFISHAIKHDIILSGSMARFHKAHRIPALL